MNYELSGRTLYSCIVSFLLIAVISIAASCHHEKKIIATFTPVDTTKVSQISWNILFDSSANQTSINQALNKIRDSIIKYFDQYNLDNSTDIQPKFEKPTFCVCDSFLYNFNVKFIVGGTGASASTPPPPPAGPKGKGELINVKYITNNSIIAESNYLDNLDTLTNIKEALTSSTVDPNTILAIVDTGLDTSLFVSKINDLLWTSATGETFYNFLPGKKATELIDDHQDKHGSGVAAIALQAVGNSGEYPKLMVLKALDDQKQGSIFSVSCAISYAVQNHATVINASLGYFGKEDSIFYHYISRTKSHAPVAIKVFAAAGNTDEIHDNTKYCSPGTNNNEIATELFYPACYSKTMDDLISVTGLSNPNTACFYQYYSNRYISLGIQNKSNPQCCIYRASFINKNYEGSSFATPVAAGIMTRNILKFGLNTPAMKRGWEEEILNAPDTPSTPQVTVKGQYILYTGRQ